MIYFFLFFSGFLLGILNSFCLYFSVNKFIKSKNFRLYMILSSYIRIIVLMIAFYFLMNNNYINMIFVLLGFLISRVVATFFVRGKR